MSTTRWHKLAAGEWWTTIRGTDYVAVRGWGDNPGWTISRMSPSPYGGGKDATILETVPRLRDCRAWAERDAR